MNDALTNKPNRWQF